MTTTDMQAILQDAMRVIAESADELRAGCAMEINGEHEWPDAEDKAEYDRRVAVLESVRALASRPDAQADERGAFESWAKSKYGCSTERYELGGYKRPELNMWWTTWQARAAAPQAEAAQEVPAGWRIEQLDDRIEVDSPSGDKAVIWREDWLNGIGTHEAQREVFRQLCQSLLAATPSPDREQVGEAGNACLVQEKCAWPDCRRECVIRQDASPSRECGERQGVALSEDRIDWIANVHCPDGLAYPNNVKNAIREALREVASAPTLGEKPQAAEPKGLTDEQRETIRYAVSILDEQHYHKTARDLRALIAKGE